MQCVGKARKKTHWEKIMIKTAQKRNLLWANFCHNDIAKKKTQTQTKQKRDKVNHLDRRHLRNCGQLYEHQKVCGNNMTCTHVLSSLNFHICFVFLFIFMFRCCYFTKNMAKIGHTHKYTANVPCGTKTIGMTLFDAALNTLLASIGYSMFACVNWVFSIIVF